METSQYLLGNPFFPRKEKPNNNLPISTKWMLCVRTPLRLLQKNKCKTLIGEDEFKCSFMIKSLWAEKDKFWPVPERSAAIWSPRFFQHLGTAWNEKRTTQLTASNAKCALQIGVFSIYQHTHLMYNVHTKFFSLIMWDVVIKVTSEAIKISI